MWTTAAASQSGGREGGRAGRQSRGVSSILAVTRRLQAKVELESKERDYGGDGWWCAYMCVCVRDGVRRGWGKVH